MAYTAEARERKKQQLNQNQSNMSTDTAKKPDLGAYKEYSEYKIEVKTFMKKYPGIPGDHFDRYEMDVNPKPKRTTIRIEPKVANQLNRKMHSRNLVLLETGARIPDKIIRKFNEEGESGGIDTEINGGYADKYIYAQ